MGASSVTTTSLQLLLCFLLLLCGGATLHFISLCSGADDRGVLHSNTCSNKERQALLAFKHGLTDPSNRLSSWSLNETHDCCQWSGVRFHNFTGAVTQVRLRNPYADNTLLEYELYWTHRLVGSISPSLLQLESLTYLDLSGNNFQGTPIPSFLGSITNLRYLNLNRASFGGLVPNQLQNLSSIRYLDLGGNMIRVDSLGWISRLRDLEYLDMSWINLHSIDDGDWLQVVSMLPSLSQLDFSNCELENMIPPPLGCNVNFSSSLQVLLLYGNDFSSRIPDWLFNLSRIREINLWENSLHGEIPESLTTLRMLSSLDLGGNSLTGSIPAGIGQLKNLEFLSLESNNLNGSIPLSIGNLTSFEQLNLGANQLSGTIPDTLWLLSNLKSLFLNSNPMLGGSISEANLTKLSKLKSLTLSSPLISISVSDPSWTPPFQLLELDVSLSKIGPEFPSWLLSQKSLFSLDISMSGIQDTVPDWFAELASRSIEYFNLAGNQIEGDLTHVLFNSMYIDISSNCFRGQLPRLSSNVKAFSAGNNTISGPVSTLICEETNRNNRLEFSNNNLSGKISGCWTHWRYLTHLNLGNNNLSGKIHATIGSLYNLEALQLSQNRLSGDIPLLLKNCTSLNFINLGANELTGLIPSWIGERNTMAVLGLRSNKFTGSIPPQLSGHVLPTSMELTGVTFPPLEVEHYIFRTCSLIVSKLNTIEF